MKTFYYIVLSALFFVLNMTTVFADCKTNQWKQYHQYLSKGKVYTFDFKLKNINSSKIILHCTSGTARWKLVTDNAICTVSKVVHNNDIAINCHYKQKNPDKKCIKIQVKCE